MKCIWWGSGVPSKQDGVLESQFTLKYLQESGDSIKEFQYFQDMGEEDISRLKHAIEKVSICCRSSTNTITEVEAALIHFKSLGVDVVVLISSATHAPRCARDVEIVLRERFQGSYKPVVMISPSSTCYAHSSPQDVIIFEPPHIPSLQRSTSSFEDHEKQFYRNKLAKRILKVAPSKLDEFNKELRALLDRFVP